MTDVPILSPRALNRATLVRQMLLRRQRLSALRRRVVPSAAYRRFAVRRALLDAVCSAAQSELAVAMGDAISAIIPADGRGFFGHRGYRPPGYALGWSCRSLQAPRGG